MESFGMKEATQFKTPQEELEYLRAQVKERERELEAHGEKPKLDAIIRERVEDYKKTPDEAIHNDLLMPEDSLNRIVLNLLPEEHDAQMNELILLLQEKGIKNALALLSKLNSPHVDDDFHRYLVEYIKEGFAIQGLKERSPLYRSLHMTLYEIMIPEGAKEQSFKELVSGMEQFYSGMLSIPGDSNKGHNYFTIELAMENIGEEFSFYAAVPVDKKLLFEKHILSVFPHAKIVEKNDDYNIFNPQGAAVASMAKSATNAIFPLKTYDLFDNDPLNAVLSSFSKIDHVGEGAAIQIVFSPERGDEILSKYQHALKRIQRGDDYKEAIDVSFSMTVDLMKGVRDFFKSTKKKDGTEKEKTPIDPERLQGIQDKVASPIFRTNVRLIASAENELKAGAILSDMESAFNQFGNTKGNSLKFDRVKKRALKSLLHQFSYRLYSEQQTIPLNLKEVTTLMHFPTSGADAAPALRRAKSGSAPAPAGLAPAGILLGVNRHSNIETKIYMSDEDRLRHFYIIGQTGTGKSSFIKNMIIQDIQAGRGICMIDPHGSDIQDVLASVPKERYEDVIYFDPSNTERPMALNMLEYDIRYPEQKTFVVNELFSIFQKLYSGVPESMGPMFEQYFRNATMLVIEDPESGSTLVDVSRVLSDKKFRDLKISRCKNPIVVQFWKEIAEKAGGEGSLANIVPYITSKFDVFLANDIMRPIIAQEKSSFNFREIMDGKKILLVNLAKGRLGDINANLIGLILVGKILMAALSRVDSFGKDLPNFYLYIDEFQNITTNSISTILSEARKYKLSLTIAHQFIAQLEEGIKNAVFGNVGSMAAFRVGAADAEALLKQFEPVFTANDLMNVDNYNAYVRLLSGGRPVRPFNIEMIPPQKNDGAHVDTLKQLSYLKYGGDRAAIEAEIMKKYAKTPEVPPMAKL
jgi:hypothetical protein